MLNIRLSSGFVFQIFILHNKTKKQKKTVHICTCISNCIKSSIITMLVLLGNQQPEMIVFFHSLCFSSKMLNVYQNKGKNNLILCITASPLILMLTSLNIYHLLTTSFLLIFHIIRLHTKAQGQINIFNLVLS